MNILSLLRAKEPPSAELRRELAGLDIAGKAAAVTAIRALRRQQLLDGEAGPALDSTEAQFTEAVREHDRAIALDEELTARLAAAEQREKIDALEARKAALEKDVAASGRAISRDYPRMLDDLAALVARDREVRAAVAQLNADMAAIGVTERLALPTSTPVKLIDRLQHFIPEGQPGPMLAGR